MASQLLAVIFSLIIPGLGQFYTGHLLRGIGMFILAVIITGLSGSPIMVIVAAIDAYLLASKKD